MPWYKAFVGGLHHHKTFELAERLNIYPEVAHIAANGLRHALYELAHPTGGFLSHRALATLERRAFWGGPPGEALQALFDVGLIDPAGEEGADIHDYLPMQGSYAEKTRKAESRARQPKEKRPPSQTPEAIRKRRSRSGGQRDISVPDVTPADVTPVPPQTAPGQRDKDIPDSVTSGVTCHGTGRDMSRDSHAPCHAYAETQNDSEVHIEASLAHIHRRDISVPDSPVLEEKRREEEKKQQQTDLDLRNIPETQCVADSALSRGDAAGVPDVVVVSAAPALTQDPSVDFAAIAAARSQQQQARIDTDPSYAAWLAREDRPNTAPAPAAKNPAEDKPEPLTSLRVVDLGGRNDPFAEDRLNFKVPTDLGELINSRQALFWGEREKWSVNIGNPTLLPRFDAMHFTWRQFLAAAEQARGQGKTRVPYVLGTMCNQGHRPDASAAPPKPAKLPPEFEYALGEIAVEFDLVRPSNPVARALLAQHGDTPEGLAAIRQAASQCVNTMNELSGGKPVKTGVSAARDDAKKQGAAFADLSGCPNPNALQTIVQALAGAKGL